MKHIISAVLLFTSSILLAQSEDSRWSWNNFVTLNNYLDKPYEEGFKLKEASAGIETGFSYFLNSSFDVSAHFGVASLEDLDLYDFGITGQYKLNNGYILDEDSRFKPYLTAGVGGSNLESTYLDIPIGLGVRFELMENLDLNVRSEYNVVEDIAPTSYLQSQIGLNIGIGQSTPKDTDGDGVIDKLDQCPEEAGLQDLNGCPPPPDSDGDGIADEVDQCPNIAGLGSLYGCPDSDGDGIKDGDDNCPNVAGLAAFDGCPDTDGDGTMDSMDECPNVAGLLNGCPDADKDGIKDSEDNCPELAGTKANDGCPEIDDSVKEIMKAALEGVKFQTGSDVITPDSYSKLDNVIKVLQDNPGFKLKISGYTDNTGNEQRNLELSDQRAKATKKYLQDKGNIDANRISAKGYGIANPIADNSTREGRAKNRRVEFEIVFK